LQHSIANNSQLVSIIVPCHNETDNVRPLHRALTDALSRRAERFEFIFVDDGSRDGTKAELQSLAERDGRVRIVELVRNFGKEIAVTAGLQHAKGNAAICLDADLQHPPALIPRLLDKWHDGAEVVIGVRRTGAQYAPLLKRVGSGLFYKLINAITEVEIVAHATDFRLLDRAVVNEFNRFTEHGRITRGLVDWLGFNRAYVEFTPAKRQAGQAAYGYFKLVNLAINSFVSMSLVPLKIAGYLGLIIMVTSGTLGAFIFVEKYPLADPWHLNFTGPAILAVIILFLVGLVLASLGLISLYIASIHAEVMNRPLYVVRPEASRARATQDQAIESAAEHKPGVASA
jgi:glycosyltransferase involved in cell wall biosynthesis